MLYRPGHYDILYKPEDVPELQPQTQPITTYLLHNGPSYHWADVNQIDLDQPFPSYDVDFGGDLGFDLENPLLQIPGMSFMQTKPPNPFPFGTNIPVPDGSLMLSEPVMPHPPAAVSTQDLDLRSMPTFMPNQALDNSLMMGYAPPQLDIFEHVPPPVQMPDALAIIPPPEPIIFHNHSPQHTSNPRDPFRKSVVQYKHETAVAPVSKVQQAPLRTKQMLQSPCSEAHFSNPEFQPISYDPTNPDASEGQQSGSSGSARGARRKSTHH